MQKRGVYTHESPTFCCFALCWCAAAVTAKGATISDVRITDAAMAQQISAAAGIPVVVQYGADGQKYAVLPNDVVRELSNQGFSLETIRTVATVESLPENKALEEISGYDGIGFPINPANSGSIIISGAPGGAVVSSVTVRIRGTALYADLCTFQLRDAITTTYTFPTWYDEFSFDHTVTGISAFNGRPVNQTWTLWG